MIGSALGRIAMAEKMSVNQLKEALQNKTLPAYIAIPLIEEKMNMQERMRSSAVMQQAQPTPPPIADRVMQRAEAAGIDRLPSNLAPTRDMAGGGIIAFEDGGEVPRFAGKDGSLIDPEFRGGDPDKTARLKIFRDELAKAQQRLAAATTQEDKARAQADIDSLNIEIANASKSAPTSTAGFGKITKIPQNDPGIAAQRSAMSLPAIPQQAAAPSMTPEEMVRNAQSITDLIYPKSEVPTTMTPEQAFAQTDKFMTLGGVDRDIFKKQGREIGEERAGIAKEKQEAKTFRILQAAADVLSGTSPFAAVNIGKGMSPAIQGLGADIKEFQKNERALRAAERDLAMSEQRFNLTRASDAQAQMLRAQDRVDKYAQNRAGLLGDIAKSSIAAESSKDIAKLYTEGYISLEQMRQRAPLDVVKLADRLKKDMPNASEKDRLEAAAKILRPVGMGPLTNLTNRVIAETSKKLEALELDPTYRKLKDKAAKGDQEAAAEMERKKQKVRDDVLDWAERARDELSGGAQPRGRTLSPIDQEALNWANSNPNDPRSMQIKQRLGVQ